MALFTEIPSAYSAPIIDNKTNGSTITVEETTTPSTVDNTTDTRQENFTPSPNTASQEGNYDFFSPFISERAVDQPRPLKVIYIGAGISGILAAIKFREAVPGLDLTIYEKNPDLGGTWYENKYPGCACGEQGRHP